MHRAEDAVNLKMKNFKFFKRIFKLLIFKFSN